MKYVGYIHEEVHLGRPTGLLLKGEEDSSISNDTIGAKDFGQGSLVIKSHLLNHCTYHSNALFQLLVSIMMGV